MSERELQEIQKKKNNFLTKRVSRAIFYICVVALPVLQFCIFYIYLNFNSIILAFQKYSLPTEGMGYVVSFAGFKNFASAWQHFVNSKFMLINSLRLLLCELIIALPLAVLFSFYIHKNFLMSKFFRVMLFMPQIISSIIFVILFKYIVNDVYSQIAFKLTGEMPVGMLDNPETRLGAVLFYNIWISFGVNVMMFTGSMSNIDPSLVEASKLDGANTLQEFWHISLPLIWPTFTTFVILILTGVFMNQMNLYTLFQVNGAELSTFGYYLYLSGLESDLLGSSPNFMNYSELSALGVILSCMTVPVVLCCRRIMKKIGPSVD